MYIYYIYRDITTTRDGCNYNISIQQYRVNIDKSCVCFSCGSTHKQEAEAQQSGESYAFFLSEFSFQSQLRVKCTSVSIKL